MSIDLTALFAFSESLIKGTCGYSEAITKHKQFLSQNPGFSEKLKHDFFSDVIVAGNIQLITWCIDQKYDIFVQAKRFDVRSSSGRLYKRTPNSEKGVTHLLDIVVQMDTDNLMQYRVAEGRFLKKVPNCKCEECTCEDESEIDVHFWNTIPTRENLTAIEKWLEEKKASNSQLFKLHFHQCVSYLEALKKYKKYLNRRYC
jgi:hypothetical protein